MTCQALTTDEITCVGFVDEGTLTYRLHTPAPIRTFIKRFDAKKYPQLIRPARPARPL